MIEKCEICGKNTFRKEVEPGYMDDGDWMPPKVVDACECGAVYDFNEGWMLSASWAAREIADLREQLAAARADFDATCKDCLQVRAERDKLCALIRRLYTYDPTMTSQGLSVLGQPLFISAEDEELILSIVRSPVN